MREIKFRAWDNENEYMITSLQGVYTALRNRMNITKQDDGYYNNGDLLKPNKGKYTLMQYTGQKDKNGKEIYEGDIVEEVYFNPKFDEQERRYGKYIVKYEEDRCGYVPFACGDGCGCCEYEVINVNNAEVIGNIYDNPDLLEKASD